MEHSKAKHRNSRVLPLTSFNENIIFPQTLKINTHKSFITSTISNPSFKKENFPQVSCSKNHISKIYRNTLNSHIQSLQEARKVDGTLMSSSSQNIETKKNNIKKGLWTKTTFKLHGAQSETLFPTSFRRGSVKPDKQILHLKSISPDGSRIHRKLFQLRQIQQVQKLINVINKKKIKKQHLQSAISLLGEKMISMRQVENKFDLQGLVRVRELQSEYKEIIKNRSRLLKKANIKYQTIGSNDSGIKIIEEMHFENSNIQNEIDHLQTQSFIESQLSLNVSAQNLLLQQQSCKFQESFSQKKSITSKNSSNQSNQLVQSKQQQKDNLNCVSNESSQNSQNQNFFDPQPQSQILNKNLQGKAVQKLKSFIKNTMSKVHHKDLVNNSTKQQITNYSSSTIKSKIILDGSSKLNLLQKRQVSPQQPRNIKVARISRRSSKFKFGQFDFISHLNQQSKIQKQNKQLRTGTEQSQNQNLPSNIVKQNQKLLALDDLSFDHPKDTVLVTQKNVQEKTTKYHKIQPKKKITKRISNNVELIQEVPLQQSNPNRNSIPVRRVYRQSHIRKPKISAPRKQDQFNYLNLDYIKSFVTNREILQMESNRLRRYLQSKNVSMQQYPKLSIASAKHKNLREHVSPNMVDQLARELRKSTIGDINNNFFQFQGFRYNNYKKDKVSYYGITDYTYKQDCRFKSFQKIDGDFKPILYEDELLQRSLQESTGAQTKTDYILSKLNQRK